MSRETYERAVEFLESGGAEEALKLAEDALRRRQTRKDVDLELDLHYLAVDCLMVLGRSEEVLGHTMRIKALCPEDPTPNLMEGIARYYLWDLDGARRCFQGLRLSGEDEAELCQYRARLLEIEGKLTEADRLYEKAADLAPEVFPVPLRLSETEIEALVKDVMESLPDPVRKILDNVLVEVRPMPIPAVHAGPDTDPDLLGIYSGSNVMERSVSEGPPGLDQVFLFQRNIERAAADREDLREQVRVTLLHEFGHHLGLDEDDLAERGLE